MTAAPGGRRYGDGMNKVYADLVRARVTGACEQAKAVTDEAALRDLVISQLIEPVLPAMFGVASAAIVSASGEQSQQTDIVIYDRSVLPPIMLAQGGMIPIEAAVYTIDVMATIRASDLKKAQDDARNVAQFNALPSMGRAGDPPALPYTASSALLAFATDLPDTKSEIDRYEAVLEGAPAAIHTVCVAGRGTWRRVNGTWLRWDEQAPHDELMGFLASILNALPLLVGRRPPAMGNYLSQG